MNEKAKRPIFGTRRESVFPPCSVIPIDNFESVVLIEQILVSVVISAVPCVV